MNTDISIRVYKPSDLQCLSTIWFIASEEAHAFLGQETLKEQQQLIENVYLPSSETWVACKAGEPVGFIGLIDTFVGGLFVDPAQQGSGIGHLLIAYSLQLKGSLQLEVYTDNHQAVSFYKRLGFKEISRRDRDDEGLPFENIKMELHRSECI